MASLPDLLASMTLEEKAGQLNHLQGVYSTDPYAKEDSLEAKIREGLVGAVTTSEGLATLRQWQKMAVEESRLGIPLLFANDIVHGYRTIFPIPLGQAASWNLDLIEKSERISATEGAAAGLNWTFAPMVDIARDARWGRTMEGSGEDPHLGSAIARARVRGIQGQSLRDKDTLIACLKHFAAYGAAEAGKEYNTVDMSEARLREVYLPPFEAGVEENARTVMNAFNTLNGIPASCHYHLLTEILKQEWGFEGITVSDAFSFHELIPHAVAEDEKQAALLCFLAGSDTDLWPGIYLRCLPDLVREGRIEEEALDRVVLKVLELKEQVGLFDDPYGRMDEERFHQVIGLPEHRQTARELALQSFVLLKNESAFPLPAGLKRLALIGPLASSQDRPDLMGNWCAEGKMEELVTILAGLRAALPEVEIIQAKGWNDDSSTTPELTAEAREAAASCDAAVIVAGEKGSMTGESASRSDITLPGDQAKVIRAVLSAQPQTATLLACGRALALEDIIEDLPNLLVIWQPGSEAGNAVADILTGQRQPQGRLPVAFPRRVGQLPLTYASLPTGRPRLGPEDDRWGISRYSDVVNEPLFPFGFGLTGGPRPLLGPVDIEPQAAEPGQSVTVRVEVSHSGDQPVVEVVQLYVRDKVASTSRPVRELKGFERVELEPGQAKTIEFVLEPWDLSFWMEGQGWVVEPGEFEVFVGSDSTCSSSGSFRLLE